MVFISGMLLGMFMGGGFCSFIILNSRKESMGALDEIQKSMLESNYVSESETERLAKFKIKDTKDLSVNISDQDKEYLLTEFIKSNKRLVPYGNVVDDKDYLYPKMKFIVYLSNNGVLYHDVPGAHMRYGFTLDNAEMEELLGSIHSECYELSLTGGPYRVLDELTGDYTEFKDNPLNVSIEVPLKLFIKTK